MIQFKAIELSDKSWIDAAVRAEDCRSADFNFANMFMWDSSYRQLVAPLDGRVAAKPKYMQQPFFAFPIGEGDLKTAILRLCDYSASRGFPFCVKGVTAQHREQLEALFPDRLHFTEDRDHFDYIYLAEKLAALSGKKLHAKRNHINRFIETHGDWRFERMTSAHLPACRAMLEAWIRQYRASGASMDGVAEEHAAIDCAFAHFDALGLEGGVLYVGEKLIAFTVGERISSDTYNIHFEKAYSDIQGAYPMINREFVRQILDRHSDVLYINREDDMGLENLRRAKQSYYPDFMVEKYSVCLCGCGGTSL